jgi:hypothetical protein
MGQQQLLLIVLGVIIVGIAVVVGINLFNANAETSTQDSIVSQGTNIGAMAQQYYKKPLSMNGGGQDFTGFTAKVWASLPANLITSTDASWGTPDETATSITFTATPLDAEYQWTVVTIVTPLDITSSVETN